MHSLFALCASLCSTGHNAIGTGFRGQKKEVGPPFNDLPEDCVVALLVLPYALLEP